MAGDSDMDERDLGQLMGSVLAMIQEKIGIVIGGISFLTFVPAFSLIPIPIAIIPLVYMAKDQLDFTKTVPLLTTVAICSLVYITLFISLRVGWIAICLKITKNEPAPFSEFFSNFDRLLSFFLAQIMTAIAMASVFSVLIGPSFLGNFSKAHFQMTAMMAAGFFLAVVVCIFLGIKFSFAPCLVIDKKMGPLEAMQASWGMVEGYACKIFLAYLCFFVVHSLLNIVPLIGFVGQLLAVAYIDLLITALYRQKNGDLVVEE